jgi:pimeloyl-ACP methyl ester carboxylesterase
MMRYRFGEYELRVDSHELLADGRRKEVEPQVFDLLRHLVENAGQLVSHDDLINVVWNGRIVSDSAISARISATRAAVGDNGTDQRIIKTIPRRGFRFLANVVASAPVAEKKDSVTSPANQQIRFCPSQDGTSIAYATTGSGYPLVKAGHWLTHLEHDWHSPVWQPLLTELNRDFSVTRYDQRGNGLSDWDVSDLSVDAFIGDLEAVVDASGLKRFALYGSSQGAPISLAYAVRHPDRVSHLILQGGYVKGRLLRGSTAEREQGQALLTLIRHGWGKAGSPLLQAFASMYIPDGTPQQISSLVDLQRLTTSPENAARIREAVDNFDVTELLGQVVTPTLVIHSQNDGVHPLDEGRRLSAGIRNSQFVLLDSGNHAVLSHEPAWEVLLSSIRHFVLP